MTRGGRSKYAAKECHCGRDDQGAPAPPPHASTPTPPPPRLHPTPPLAPQNAAARCRPSGGPLCESCSSGWSASTSTLPSASSSSSRARCGLQPHAYSLLPHAYSLLPHAYSLQPHAYSLQPYAHSLQPYAYSLQPYAYGLQPHALWPAAPPTVPPTLTCASPSLCTSPSPHLALRCAWPRRRRCSYSTFSSAWWAPSRCASPPPRSSRCAWLRNTSSTAGSR